MNVSKTRIIVGIIITVGIIILISNQEMISENIVVNHKTGEIEIKGTMENQLTNISGYAIIDKSQYNVGEKIFFDMNELSSKDKGVILFLRPINDTHRTTYMSIPFDGAKKDSVNLYLEPKLDKDKGICSTEDLVGIWSIVFYETTYPNIEFKIKNQISNWDKRTFESVC